jgi:CRISPR/Cas system CMR-associated protein Cmr5 small subunit
MESTINEMLADAIAIIEGNKKIKDDKNVKVKGIYESYLSQFGPMIVQMELPCTMAVYNTTKAKGGGNRALIVEMLFELIKAYDITYLNSKNTYDAWAKYLMTERIEEDVVDLIMDASVALKRAIRTFPLTDKNDEE